MDKCSAIPILIDLFQVNDKLRRIMFGISQNFCSKQGYDMVRYDLSRFILEVGVVDAGVGIEPSHFVSDEFAWDKTLKLSGTVSQ